ncbi:phospholipase D-like domain-containing protein, partial [Pediococcus acidilactici]|uniref:phospholipase D-like domain-containing protein n=1 Tax=Pediococcus acidilactici TaxID=1254 RepID=UPI003A90B8BF
TTKNEITLFTDGREKFDALIEDIKQAEDHIHFQYYIYRSDALGEEVRDALTEAARRGVKVRALLDAWGSTQVSSSFFQNLKKAGGEIAFFFPLFVP